MVLESTTYPGTTEELVRAHPRGGVGPGRRARTSTSGYSPERIDPGNADLATWRTPPRWSRASTPPRWRPSPRFYDRIVEQTVPVSGTREAELTKLLENTFRHVNIALVNELAMFAADLGIDVWEAIDAASTKPFGYMRFTPGPGWAATACPSTRATCRGRCGAAWASRSASSSWPTTSTSTCPTTWCGG